MARYDGMDEIIQRLQSRFVPENQAPERIRPQPLSSMHALTESRPYEIAVESIGRMQREAQRLSAQLDSGRSDALSPREHDDLHALLGKLLQELWTAELALQTVAPYE